MTKAELVDHLAATAQLPKHQIDAVSTRCLQGIMDALQAGDTVIFKYMNFKAYALPYLLNNPGSENVRPR